MQKLLHDAARSLRRHIKCKLKRRCFFIKSNRLKVCDCWFVRVERVTQNERHEDEKHANLPTEQRGHVRLKSSSQNLPTSHAKCIRCTHTLSKTKGPVGGSVSEGKYLVKTITTAEVQGVTAAHWDWNEGSPRYNNNKHDAARRGCADLWQTGQHTLRGHTGGHTRRSKDAPQK